jgi:fibronectin type 3 domain-containing protein
MGSTLRNRLFGIAALLLGAGSLSAQALVTQEAVILTWDAPASSSDPVAGYNVYRAKFGASTYQQINPALIVTTIYADMTVLPLADYDYIVESVDAEGVTSAPSNTANVVLPQYEQPPTLGAPNVTLNL